MKTQIAFLTAIGIALAAAACAPKQLPRTIGAAPTNKVWARADGLRMAGNPALTRQGQTDLQQCRSLATIDGKEGQYDLKILNGCMTSRGYIERDI